MPPDFTADPLAFVLATPCSLAVINQEDLTGETDQQNLPASTWQYPNWRRKMKVAVEELESLEEDLRQRISAPAAACGPCPPKASATTRTPRC